MKLTIALATLLASVSTGFAASSLINSSTRALAGSGANAQITGIVVSAPSNELRWVLVRSIGPSLSTFGVPNPLNDPVLKVYDSKGTVIAVNDNWGTAPNLTLLSTVATAAGAFPVTNTAEAAALIGLPAGNFTVVSEGKANHQGIVLSEVYEYGAVAAGTRSQTLTGIAAGSASFTTLTTALRLTGLDAVLAQGGPYTVFAPTDAAFAALPAGTLSALIANPTQLADVLKFHVVSGEALSTGLSNNQVVPTLLANKSLTVNLTGGVKINSANVTTADVLAVNGVIHVIDAVLVP